VIAMTKPFEKWIGLVEIDGRKVVKFRNRQGLNLDALAKEAAVGKKTIERWEAKGVVNADVERVRDVAKALEIEVLDLVTEAFFREHYPEEQTSDIRTVSAPPELNSQPVQPVLNRRFQLPPDLSDFIGRDEELREIAEQFREDGRVGISSLRGMGGVGKTTIAIHIAHRIKEQFPDAQLLLDLQGVSQEPVTTVEAISRFIRDFDPIVPNLPDTEEKLLPIYRSILADKRALIVLDNAGSDAQIKNLIAGNKTGFIITSRHALALDGVSTVRIDVFTPEKSLQLLRGIVGTKGADAELLKVAKACGYLPLALRVAGQFLRLKVGWTVSQYLAALRKERLRWLKVGNDPQKDVEAVLKLSSTQLVNDDVDLATRWHYLAECQSDFDADAAAAVWEMKDQNIVREDLSKLVDRSLVLFDEATFRYRLHDLMKPIAQGLFA
jgi:transcriptional regulator with XRE-family HTH domain